MYVEYVVYNVVRRRVNPDGTEQVPDVDWSTVW